MKKLIYLLLLLASCMACKNTPQRYESEYDDLQLIKDSGELVALTLYSSISYFKYRGEEMGFHYELGKQFAKEMGVNLRIEVVQTTMELIEKLQNGEGDIILYPLAITKERKDSIEFCGEEIVTHQVLVQRNLGKGKNLNDVTDLIGQEVYVTPGKYFQRLDNLNNELGGGIKIHQVEEDSLSVEDLITQVARGKIPYTISNNDIAQLNRTYYPNLNIDLVVSYDQRSSWAVRKGSVKLAEAVNKWHEENQTSPEYTATMKRYFESSKSVPHTAILSLSEGKISKYDHLFKKYAKNIDWDWRLLAALAYTESNFNPEVVSWAGALGLMQLMPATARSVGVPAGMEHDPEESIKGAVKYIASTIKSLRMVPDEEERIKFVLAAYNGGLGHVYDAMALAEKYGMDKYVWNDNVEKYVLLKSNEEYFNDPVCKNGYFRGIETYNFVRDIGMRFNTYKEKIKH